MAESLKVSCRVAFGMFVLASVGNLAGHLVDARTLKMCAKPLIVPSLALMCWSLLKENGVGGWRAKTLIFALVFGTAGDVLLMFSGQAAFLAGLVAFLIGHFFYFLTLILPRRSLSGAGFALTKLLPVSLIFITAFTAQLFNVKGFLGVAVTAYALAFAFCINAGIQSAVITRQRLYWVTVLGYALFVSSDTLLATGVFTDIMIPQRGFLVMLTYIIAQFLIALSLTFAQISGQRKIMADAN